MSTPFFLNEIIKKPIKINANPKGMKLELYDTSKVNDKPYKIDR